MSQMSFSSHPFSGNKVSQCSDYCGKSEFITEIWWFPFMHLRKCVSEAESPLKNVFYLFLLKKYFLVFIILL